MIKKIFYLSLFVWFSLGESWVFSVQDSLYSESVLSDFYGVQSWKRASIEQKIKMVDDFLIREGAFLLGKREGLRFSPSFVQKSYNKKRQLLVNYVYQIEVAHLGLDSLRFSRGINFLKKDRLVYHLLFGFKGSSLRVPIERSKEESYFLCSSILDTITFSSLPSLALTHSDDGSAKRNFGKLGWVSWGSTVPSFEFPVFSGNVGVFLGPIESEFGYHIAYVEEERPSSFSFLEKEEFLDAVLIRASSRDVVELRRLSAFYDSLVLASGGLVFNDSLVSKLYASFKAESGSYKNDIVSVFQKNEGGVVCSFSGEGVGLDWFVNRLSFYEPSNRPNVKNLDSFYSFFKTLLLQEQAYLKGLHLGFDKKQGFKKQLLSYEKDLLYTLYFKNIVNAVALPESLAIKQYYIKNRVEKYTSSKSLTLQEIRVEGEEKIDSILSLYIKGAEFSSLAKRFSLDYSAIKKGVVGPLERGFKRGALSSFFEEGVFLGFVGPPLENVDGSFSLYSVKKILPETSIPLKKVHSRISSILHKNLQEKAQKESIKKFYKELNIVKNDSLF